MLVGIDFDNTIISYDSVFHQVALEKGLIPADLPASKGQVRDYIRAQGKEKEWIELQGCVYGAMMLEAKPFPGVLDFFSQCKKKKIGVCIISHRTRYPFSGPQYDLHEAAKNWVESYGFYQKTGLSPDHVFFELTKEEKINRIEKEACDLFIDDLPEFLVELISFSDLRCVLFDPNDRYPNENRFERATSWGQVEKIVSSGAL